MVTTSALIPAYNQSMIPNPRQSTLTTIGRSSQNGHSQDGYVFSSTVQTNMLIMVQYANGYVPPPKLPWKKSFMIGLKGFWKWFLTPAGFLITLYGLNVVAWGGMLFLLLCNAAPAMCTPTCDDINSPRR